MYHVNGCDEEQSVCGCCDCTFCEIHSELSQAKYDEDYEDWLDGIIYNV